MGNFKKKLKKNILNGADPYKVIKMMRAYRRDKMGFKNESLYDICKKLHLSIYTFNYIQNYSIHHSKNETPYARKNRILLNKHLNKIYNAMERGWTDKIEKMRKLAASVSSKGEMKKLSNDGKTHDILPLNLEKEKEDSLFKLESFRYIIGEMEKKLEDEYNPDRVLFNVDDIPSSEDKDDFIYKDIPDIPGGILVHKHLIEKYNVDKYMDYFFDDWKFNECDAQRTLTIMIQRKINMSNFISGTVTNYEMDDKFKMLCIILGYCLGVNTTFLLGDNTNPVLFEGIVGSDFRVEHCRMKLLHYWDTGVFEIEDKKKFMRVLLNPIDIMNPTEEWISNLCKKKEMDPAFISGKYVPAWINRADTLITTPQFKADMKYSSDFISV